MKIKTITVITEDDAGMIGTTTFTPHGTFRSSERHVSTCFDPSVDRFIEEMLQGYNSTGRLPKTSSMTKKLSKLEYAVAELLTDTGNSSLLEVRRNYQEMAARLYRIEKIVCND
jgi:hypothetical protein